MAILLTVDGSSLRMANACLGRMSRVMIGVPFAIG